MSVEPFRFGDSSYEALGLAGVEWLDALHVLTEARPRMVRRIGDGTLVQVAAVMSDGRMLSVTLVEDPDEEYLVVDARWLDEDEAEPLRTWLERGNDGP
jgi:hypothetical protein